MRSPILIAALIGATLTPLTARAQSAGARLSVSPSCAEPARAARLRETFELHTERAARSEARAWRARWGPGLDGACALSIADARGVALSIPLSPQASDEQLREAAVRAAWFAGAEPARPPRPLPPIAVRTPPQPLPAIVPPRAEPSPPRATRDERTITGLEIDLNLQGYGTDQFASSGLELGLDLVLVDRLALGLSIFSVNGPTLSLEQTGFEEATFTYFYGFGPRGSILFAFSEAIDVRAGASISWGSIEHSFEGRDEVFRSNYLLSAGTKVSAHIDLLSWFGLGIVLGARVPLLQESSSILSPDEITSLYGGVGLRFIFL